MNAQPNLAPWPHTGAVLAGGHSRQMSTPQESLRLPSGRTMIEHVLDPLITHCRQVVVVGECRGYGVRVSDTLLHILDREPDMGPLGGLVTLLGSGLDTAYVVVACDQMLLTAELLARLTDGDPARPHLFTGPEEDVVHLFPGYYPASLLDDAQNLLGHGHRSLRDLAARSDPLRIPLPAADVARLFGVNTPEQRPALERIYDERIYEMKDAPY
jgi:molybdenum cofactor guanylyltransferase